MRPCVLFYGDVFISFDFAFDRDHFYFLFGDYLLVVLDAFFNGIEVLLDNFPGDSFHHPSFFVCDDLSLHWHFLHIGPVLVLYHLLLIRYVAHSALP